MDVTVEDDEGRQKKKREGMRSKAMSDFPPDNVWHN